MGSRLGFIGKIPHESAIEIFRRCFCKVGLQKFSGLLSPARKVAEI